MSSAISSLPGRGRRTLKERLAYYARVVQVVAHAEYKLKYSGSALGYVWSVIKPLGLFLMLYIVFGRFFKLNVGIPHYPVYLLIGIVLWTYFLDATTLTMTSIVERGSLVSKLVFPRLIIPISVTITAGITLLVNLSVIVVFIAANRIIPTFRWFLLIPLLAELYIFTLGVGLILATLFVRLRDLRQVWELLLQLLFYASPILYPASYLPPWWKPIAFLNPFVQVMQHARNAILPNAHTDTPTTVYHGLAGELIPLGIVAALFVGGIAWFRAQAPWFAERL
jgi:ABC-2 type transport system permease protein